MKSLKSILILVIALFIAESFPLSAQTPEQLYQRGLVKEEGEGAMEDAIELYSQIADNSNADQALRAKALLHIGMCYERMGIQEAVEAYQRLVSDFPTQKKEVAIARERLNRLILTDRLSQKDEKKALLIRKVLPDTDFEPLGSPSPDGRYISFIDWNSGGNVCILNLETKEKRCLTDFKDPNEQAYYSCWSPDGKQIAYFWWVFDKNQYNLSVVDVKESKSRDLLISDKFDWIELGNWTSDGKYIFATISLREEPKSEILRVSTADGSIKLLKKFEISYTGGKPYISPDGQYLAYDLPDKEASGNSDIYLLSLANGQENAIIRHPSHDYILGWTPDGNNILFATDRRGTADAMIIAVEEGIPAGQPKPVKQNIGPIIPMGLTQDGSFFYGQWPGAINIFSAEINFDEGKLMKKPTLLIQRFEGRNYSPDYSSDGKFLAYISKRGVLNKGNPGRVLCIRNLDTDEELVVNPDPQMSGSMSDLQWSPDNHSILLTGDNQEGHSRIYKYDLQLRKFLPLVTESNDDSSHEYAYPLWSQDGTSVYYLNMSRYSPTSRIMVRNIATGVDRELYNYSSDDFMDRLFNISLSPDGKWLAAINRGENRVVRLISTNDGKTHDLYKFKLPGGYSFSQIWSKDGKYIVFPFNSEESGWNLMRVALDGGEKQIIEINIKGIQFPSLHPNGQTLAFTSAGYSFPENNIWEMKNFLPLEKDPEGMLAEEPEGIRIKQVWESPYLDDLGTVSYDGLFRSCVDWEGSGDLAIHNLINGEIRPLTHKASLGDTGSFVLNTAISKNGKQIASAWWRPYNTTDLELFDVENLTSNMLYSQEGEEVYPASWLSDHEFVARRVIPDEGIMQIVSFNIQNKSLQVKKSFNKIQRIPLACSPDEKYIAYHSASDANNENLDIHLLHTDGNIDIPLITHPANDRVFGWVPGRKEFLFLSDRSGTWDLWAVRLDGTKISGPAKRIYADIGEVVPMGFTQNGKCYFGFVRRNFYTSIAPLDVETGEIAGYGKSLKGPCFGVKWSPDGQSLAYVILEDNIHLVVQDVKTGKEHNPSNKTIKPRGFISWSRDGNSILVVGMEKDQLQTEGNKIFLIDIKTGQTDEVLELSDYEFNIPEDDAFPMAGLEWFPDGKSFYYLFFKDRLVKHDLETGKDKILFKHSDFTRHVLDLSPDGTNLLFGLEFPGDKKSRLFTMPAEGGKEKEVCTVQEADNFSMALWSPDGQYIYFTEKTEGTNLWRVSAQGGIPQKVWSSENTVEIFDIHPDGNHVAFSIRERKSEVRVIENLGAELSKVFKKNE